MIALRRLSRRPSFTLPAVGTLALGIGATTATFSAANEALLSPLPYADAEDIYVLRAARVDGAWSNGYVSSAELHAVVSGAPSVVSAAGTMGEGTDVLLADDGRNRQLNIRIVTESFFDLAGVPLALGRATHIGPRESSYGAAVLSHRIWEQAYASDPEIVGGTLRFPVGSATIVGVAPRDFDLPGDTDVWMIFAPSPTSVARAYTGFLRVRPGTSPAQLSSELGALMTARVDDGAEASGRAFTVTPLVDSIVGDLGPILWIVFAAAAVLLALSCANVAALILARGGAQARELAIRKALGARRAALWRQLLTESLVVSGLGTGIGIAIAYVGVRALPALGGRGLPRLEQVDFDFSVLLVAIVTLVTTAIFIGAVPMLRLATTDVRGLVGEGGRSLAGEWRSRGVMSGLVVVEIALAVVSVTSAGWLVRSYANLTTTDPGFESESRLVFRTMLIGSSYLPIDRMVHDENGTYLIDDSSGETPQTWLRDLGSRLEELDEFRAVGLGSVAPFHEEPQGMVYISAPGAVHDPNSPQLSAFRFVSPDFFAAMGIEFLAGRTFLDSEPATTVIVNEAFVRAYLVGEDPIGSTFATGFEPGRYTAERTIVGVVSDVRYRSLREPDGPAFYIRDYPPAGYVVVSTSLADPTPLIPAVRAAVDAVEPGIPITIDPMGLIVSTELGRHRLGLLLMLLFAAAALLLAGVGIHGVVGHGTSVRAREFAVRLAMGAQPLTLAASVMKHGGRLWLIGILIGVGVAYVVGRVASARLYQVSASDPGILAAAVFAVSALTLAAFSLSALKGSRVDAGSMLKVE